MMWQNCVVFPNSIRFVEDNQSTISVVSYAPRYSNWNETMGVKVMHIVNKVDKKARANVEEWKSEG